jgi:hypothetical protein
VPPTIVAKPFGAVSIMARRRESKRLAISQPVGRRCEHDDGNAQTTKILLQRKVRVDRNKRAQLPRLKGEKFTGLIPFPHQMEFPV